MSVPESIRSALVGRPSRIPVGGLMPVSRGQVRRVCIPEADPVSERMVLVLRVDSAPQRKFAEIMLVHPYSKLATSSDLIVSPERSAMPYRIVVETDTRGVVWEDKLDQYGALIGELDRETLEALGDVALSRPFDRAGLATGLSLRGRLDPRWDFKAQEGVTVRSLAADCTSTLLDDDLPLQLDPGCLAPGLLATCDDFESTALKLLHIVTEYEVVFDLDDVTVLEVVGALKVSNWTRTFGSLGDELYKSFWPLVERALSPVDLPDDLVADDLIDEWTKDRKSDAGTFQRRPGYHVVSASYVCKRDRESSSQLANDHGYQLIDV